jgi:hypothetical protein
LEAIVGVIFKNGTVVISRSPAHRIEPLTVRSPVLGLKLNAVAVVLMLGVWLPVPATNTG